MVGQFVLKPQYPSHYQCQSYWELMSLNYISSISSMEAENCMMVVTGTQAMRQLKEDTTATIKELESGAQSHSIEEVPTDSVSIGREFDEEIFMTVREKVHKTRCEKRQSCKQYQEINKQMSIPEPVGVSATEVHDLANLDIAYSTEKTYYWHGGLLYHHWKPHGRDTNIVVNQLVLPQQCRVQGIKFGT